MSGGNVINVINVIGLGYIGLPTSLVLAANGNQVVGTDLNPELVQKLNQGEVTFEEKGLKELFADAVKGDVQFTTEYQKADVYIIAVPTPYNKKTKEINADYVISALDTVLDVCPKGAIIVIESTISPGTIDKRLKPELKAKGFTVGEDLHLVHAPERIIPGNMIYELTHNSRTIGADNKEIAEQVKEIYASFCKGEIVLTSIAAAELSKVVENTFRDINIAFANELAMICRSDNIDVHEVIAIANRHPRVNILSPGPGVGGHCIPVDPWFLVGDYPELTPLIKTARLINDGMPEFVIERVYEIMKEENLSDIGRVGFYGLTYKENVDDYRESPTLQVLEVLDRHLAGGRVQIYDPYIKKDIVANQHHDLDGFLDAVDLVIVMVAHDEFKQNFDKFADKVIYDTKNVCPLDKAYKL